MAVSRFLTAIPICSIREGFIFSLYNLLMSIGNHAWIYTDFQANNNSLFMIADINSISFLTKISIFPELETDKYHVYGFIPEWRYD